MRTTRLLLTYGLLLAAAGGCTHNVNHLSELAAPHVGCNDDDVGIFEQRAAGENRTAYIAYCHGQSYDCEAEGDHAQCTRHGRALVQDDERARVSTVDREVHRSGEGHTTLLTVSLDAGRSRLTVYGYPRASGAPLTIVVDSRLRESTRENCPFTLVAGADAVTLTQTAHETTSYGERTTLTAPIEALRIVAAGETSALRVCTEDLPISEADRTAVRNYLARWDEANAEAR